MIFQVKFNVTYAYLKDGFRSHVDYLTVFLRSAVVKISKLRSVLVEMRFSGYWPF